MSSIPPGDEWQPAPRLTEPQLTGSFWSFGMLGAGTYCPFLVLAPDGLMGIHLHPNEDMWQVTGGQLAFTSSRGAVTTRFEAARTEAGVVVGLAGRILVPGYDAFHELRRVEHPAQPAPPSTIPAVQFLSRPAERRPNLVVLRSGPGWVEDPWGRDLPDGERNWDLCVVAEMPDPAAFADAREYVAQVPPAAKFPTAYALLHEASPFWDYERIWFPDEDLRISCSGINRLFHLARRYGLDLAQPSLQADPDSYVYNWFALQQADCLLRFVPFVDTAAPMFSQRALRICLGSFRDSAAGAGLGHLWPGLLGAPRARVAVIDEVSVTPASPLLVRDPRQRHDEEMAVLRTYRWRNANLPPLKVSAPLA